MQFFSIISFLERVTTVAFFLFVYLATQSSQREAAGVSKLGNCDKLIEND